MHLREFDNLAVEAKQNSKKLDMLINQCEFFIIKAASGVSRKYISKSDDEYSISLMAFVQAVEDYEYEKGSFFSFAELLIRRRLVDYFRTGIKNMNEIPVNPYIFTSEADEEDIQMQSMVVKQIAYEENYIDRDIKDEIAELSKVLKLYGFTFMDIAEQSPKAEKTKAICAKAASYVLMNPELLTQMRTSHQFPIKIIEKNCGVSRKSIDRHRKYLIAAIEILSGDYPYLAEYLKYIRKE